MRTFEAMKYELKRWKVFQSIKHKHIPYLTLWYPLCVSVFFSIAYLFWPTMLSITDDNGFIDKINNIVLILPAFFLAALAAIATFNRSELDILPEDYDHLEMEMRVKGKMMVLPLTSRMFLTSLFSYLTGISFIILLFSSIVSLFWPGVHKIIALLVPGTPTLIAKEIADGIVVFFITLLFSRVIFCGAYGLYFLSEKILRPNDV